MLQDHRFLKALATPLEQLSSSCRPEQPSKRSSRVRTAVVVFCLLLVFFLSPARSVAQSTFGSIVGTVKDSSGALVAGASVRLTNLGTAAERTVITDQHGDYSFLNLNPGKYQVTV